MPLKVLCWGPNTSNVTLFGNNIPADTISYDEDRRE